MHCRAGPHGGQLALSLAGALWKPVWDVPEHPTGGEGDSDPPAPKSPDSRACCLSPPCSSIPPLRPDELASGIVTCLLRDLGTQRRVPREQGRLQQHLQQGDRNKARRRQQAGRAPGCQARTGSVPTTAL